MKHLVYPEMLDLCFPTVISYQVVILVIPGQRPGADLIISTVPAKKHLFIHIPVKILETDLCILTDRSVDAVYIIINTFVHSLDPFRHIDLTVQLGSLILACQSFDLMDQLC